MEEIMKEVIVTVAQLLFVVGIATALFLFIAYLPE